MDSILLTVRWGSIRHLVRVEKGANFDAFKKATLTCFPTIDADALVKFHILIPGADPTKLTEAEICDSTDLSALRTGDLVVLKVSGPSTVAADTLPVVAPSITSSPLKTPAPVTKSRSNAVTTASPVVTSTTDSRRPSTAVTNAAPSTPPNAVTNNKTPSSTATTSVPPLSASSTRDRGTSVASISTTVATTTNTVPTKLTTTPAQDTQKASVNTISTGTPTTNARVLLSREPSVASMKEIVSEAPSASETLPGTVTPSKPLSSTPAVSTLVSPPPVQQVIQQSQLGSPRVVLVPSSASYNPVSNLAKVGLIVDPETSLISVDTRPSSAWGTPILTSTSSFLGLGSTPSKKVVTRKVVLIDFLNDGPAAHSTVDTSIAGLIQTEVLNNAKKRNHAFVPVDIPRDSINGVAHVRVFASSNWETASTLLVIIPSEGMPPGIWDTHTSIVAGTRSVSITPYLKELEQLSWASSLGIVLANPYNNHSSDKSPIPGNETPVAHILTLWDNLLTGKPSKEGEETVTGPSLAFLSHGAGADLVLALLTDATRGIAARARTRAVAMISPKQPPRQVLAAAVASSSEGGTSRAAAGILRTQLRQKGMAWNGELRSSVRPLVPQADGSLPLEIQEIDSDGTDTTTLPYFSDDYGCHVQPVALAIPGTAAYREEATALANGYTPYAARKNVLSFLDHLLRPAEAENTKNMNSAATWVAAHKTLVNELVAAKLAANPPAVVSTDSPVKESTGAVTTDAPTPSNPSPVKTENEPAKTPVTISKPKGKSRARELMEAAASPVAVTEDTVKPSVTSSSESVPSTPLAKGTSSSATSVSTDSPSKTVEAAYIPPVAIPEAFAAAAERAYRRIQTLHLDVFAPGGGKEWRSNGTVSGVQTYVMSPDATKPADTSPDDAFVGARGDSIIPFPLAAVAEVLLKDMDARYELDGQLDKVEPVERLTDAAVIDRMKFKAVFPTDPRDFVTLSAWQVNEDGALYMYGTSVEHPKVPLVKGYVRGRLDIGGWVITPLSLNDYNTAARSLGLRVLDESTYRGACRVAYLFRTSIGGNLPKFVVQQVTVAQAKQPAMVTKILERKYGGKDGLAKLAKLPPWTNPVTVSSSTPSKTTAAATESSSAESTGEPSGAPTESSTSASEPTVGDNTAVSSSTTTSTAAVPSTNLNGRWKVNKAKSQTLDTLLKEMGVPYVARVFAASLEVTTTIVQTVDNFEITESSSLGDAKTVIPLDWNSVEEKGMDGKMVSRKAITLTGVDEIPTDDVDTFVSEYKTKGAPAPPNGAVNYPRYGTGSGVVVSVAVLPDKLGITRDERHLVSPTVLRLTTVYFRDGTVKARVTRFLDRLDSVPHELLAPVFVAPTTPTVTSVDAVSEAVNTVVSAVETPVVTVDDATVHETVPAPAPSSSSTVPVVSHPATPKLGHENVYEPGSVPPNTIAKEDDSILTTPIKIKPTLAEERALAALAALTNPPKSDEPIVPEGWSFAKWIPDEQATACRTCKVAFTSINRVHHCRSCGLAFCDTCSSARLPLAYLTAPQLKLAKVTVDQYVRNCNNCALPVIQEATIVGSAGGKVVLKGRNFGSMDMITIGRTTAVYVDGGPSNTSIRAKGISAEPVEHTSLTFIMPPGIGSRTIRVEVENRVGTFQYTYASPALESAEAVETDGGLCVLRGINFPGYDAELPLLDIRLNGNPCRAERVAEPFKSIVIRVPAGSGGTELNEITLSAPGIHPLPSPLPYSFAPATLFAGRVIREPLPDGTVGAVLILYGASFGTNSSNVTVTVAGMVCKDVQLLVPHSKLRVVLPDHIVGTARNGRLEDVVVTIAGQTSAPFSAQL